MRAGERDIGERNNDTKETKCTVARNEKANNKKITGTVPLIDVGIYEKIWEGSILTLDGETG